MTVEPLLADSQAKLRAALALVFASAAGYAPFALNRVYSPQEREPYDALSDRFLRAFESSLKFFRTWERVREAHASETFRDLLLRMEKVGLISGLAHLDRSAGSAQSRGPRLPARRTRRPLCGHHR